MITIHMTTFRRLGGGLLQQAVQSVLDQSFRDFEFIICDDASYDGTADYLASVAASDSRVTVIRNSANVNSVSISLGRCMERASPDRPYLTWMFDDCILLPGALAALVEDMRRKPCEFLYATTDVRLLDGSAMPVGNADPDAILAAIDQSSALVPNGGLLIDRRVFDRIGWYDSSILLRRSCDWDLFRRMFHAGLDCRRLDRVVMEEFGELQSDSLRNSFTTTFPLMRKYVDLRDRAKVNLSVKSCLAAPVDWIPSGDWSDAELQLIAYIFVEYLMSIGNLAAAYPWARRLADGMPTKPFYLENLTRKAGAADGVGSLMAAGAFIAGVAASFKEFRKAEQS